MDNSVTEEKLKEFFEEKYKSVVSTKIVIDNITKLGKGYGFVEFITPELAKEVLQNLNGKLIPNSQKTFKLNSATYSAGKVASMGNFPSMYIYKYNFEIIIL